MSLASEIFKNNRAFTAAVEAFQRGQTEGRVGAGRRNAHLADALDGMNRAASVRGAVPARVR